jgi:hypothetical protein
MQGEITKYTLVTVTRTKGQRIFEEEVNKKIRAGWQPLGGVTVIGVGQFAQAMVKIRKEQDG